MHRPKQRRPLMCCGLQQLQWFKQKVKGPFCKGYQLMSTYALTSEDTVLPQSENSIVQGTSAEGVQYPGDINQALIELGSTVCKVREPDCGSCPLRPWCRAYVISNSDVQKVVGADCYDSCFYYPVLNWISYSQRTFQTSRMRVASVRRCRVTSR
jgi:hypothetical protein